MNRDDDVFAQALDLSAEERRKFLEQIGREDPALRHRVEALLAGFEAAGGFLEQPAIERPPELPEEKPGDRLGRYTLVRKLGEGGCGVVYLAEQSEPVRRQVALKIIKLGMDTKEVITRFEAERQALAMMDHPDIARVFDAGATGNGRPYFVMEFVDGVPVTRFCDEQKLALPARLELFARICVALQHAHQKGIIHRDIKPSNILVNLRDGEPAPKIIDFGIAKATQGRLTEQTLLTALHQFIGTPAYMSPEQAELRELDVDTRSDVYSLGVLLYELLTGQPPYNPRSLQQAGIDEIRRIIREIDPPRPSAAVSTLNLADRTTIAAHRRAVPTRLTSVLAGDLDWIVMRCLEKQRNRRYDSASALAEDIRRHLRNEPVVARPPSWLYKTQRFVRRNRLACASAAAVLLAIVLGAIAATTQAIRATRAEHVAVAERDAAEIARAAEAAARADAQRRQEQAEELLAFMLGDFRAGLQELGRLDLLDAVGERALLYFDEAAPRDLTDTALTRQARAITQIGEVRMDQAQFDAAQAAFRSAFERAAALAGRYPDNPDILFERAQAEFWNAFVARARGDRAGLREWLLRYRDSAQQLGSVDGNSVRARSEMIYAHHNLAILDFEEGDFLTAETGFETERDEIEALLATGTEDDELYHGLADAHSWLGSVAEFDGRLEIARGRYADTIAVYARLTEMDPLDVRWQVRYGDAHGFRARVHAMLGDYRDALEDSRRGRTIIEPAVAADPTNQRWEITVLRHQMLEAALLQRTGEPAAGTALIAAVRARLETLQAGEPSSFRYRRDLVVTATYQAWFLMTQDAREAAEAAILPALSLGRDLVTEDPADRAARGEFAMALVLASTIATQQADAPLAAVRLAEAAALFSSEGLDSRDWRWLDPLARIHALRGDSATSSELQARLREFGYVPLIPFAVTTPVAALAP